MTEKVTSYLAMGVMLALVVQYPEVISGTINAFAKGVSGVVGGIVAEAR